MLSARHRGDDACPPCGASLKTQTIAGRASHLCSDCQPRPSS
ncbi:MAG: hypothetical protein GVY16_05730 [Planctomycetes bacterium]|nr:hypothetical protein [Planctomycetota bacterium]